MNTPEIIEITTDKNGEQLVSGRELHKFLEVKTRFNDWFTDMTQYGFIENVDYTSFTEKRVKPQGGRPSIDHAIKLDMAKEISMIQRTDKGKEARRYFIKVEKEHKKQIAIPTTHREMAQLALAVTEETNQRVDQIEKDITDLKENTVICTGDYNYIGSRVNKRVSEVAKSFGKITSKQRGELYKDINGGIKKITGVNARTQLRQKHYEAVVKFILDWEPSTATKTIVRQMSLNLDDIA